MTTIRTVRPEEITDMIGVYRKCGIYTEAISNENAIRRGYEKNPDLFVVAEEDGRIVGTVQGQSNSIIGMIWKLGVLPDYRRRGIGKVLLKEMMKRLRDDGCVGANLLLRHDNMDVAEFYEKLGWEKWPNQLMVFFDLKKIEKYD